jgi:hypothetical protein
MPASVDASDRFVNVDGTAAIDTSVGRHDIRPILDGSDIA